LQTDDVRALTTQQFYHARIYAYIGKWKHAYSLFWIINTSIKCYFKAYHAC